MVCRSNRSRFHFLHKWTQWQAISSDKGLWDMRRCLRCNKRQVELAG